MSDPLVSVILPVFDGRAHIREALECALRQTCRRIEVIVVDDGSRDGTGALVDEMASRDSRVRLIRQSNQGVAAARNRAIDAARGEFIAPLDADDLWDATKLERQVFEMEVGGPKTGFVYCWWVLIDEMNRILDSSPRWQVRGLAFEELIEVNFTGSASVPLYRRACLEEAGGYEPALRQAKAQGCEDWEVALRIAERHHIGVVPAFLTGYRRGKAGMSANCRQMWQSHRLVMMKLSRHRPDIPRTVFLRSRAQFALHLAGISFWSGAPFEAALWALRGGQPELLLSVLPYLPRTFASRLSGTVGSAPRVKLDGKNFDSSAIPPTLISYDEIYERRWKSRRKKQQDS